MRKYYFPAGIIIVILALLLTSSCNNNKQKTAAEKAQDSVTAMIKRGDYLVNSICNCMHCHATRDFTKFSGPVIHGTEGKGGEEISPGIFVRNITPYTLGSWTDDEIYKVLTTGIRKNGDTLVPLMPYMAYAKMPKQEIYSIIAYLRTLKSIENNVPERKISDTLQPFWTTLYKNLYLKHAEKKILLSSPDDKVKLGEYLVNAGNCKGCHTKFDRDKMDFDMDAYLSGGRLLKNTALGIAVNSANLTPDTATGIGAWTEEIFLAKFNNYRDSTHYNHNPGKYNSVMPWTIVAKMNDDDLKAIYTYLRSIKPIKNKVEKWPQ
ncbi:MAG: c-type cytochrome [Chitinophagales bacterium]